MFRTVYRLPFRLLGIPVQLDITFLLVLPLLAWIIGRDLSLFIQAFGLQIDAAPLLVGIRPYLIGLVAGLALFLSVLIHELGHSVVGQRYGLKIKNITLWILGGMAQFERIPQRRGIEAVMAIAGPLTSFLLAGAAWVLFHLTPVTLGEVRFILAYLMYMNLVLAIFNLLPALPLDGGRVLRSLLALRMSYLKATHLAAATSKFLAIILGLMGFLFGSLWILLIAFFIYMAVSGESQYATVAAMLRGIRVEDLMTREVRTVSTGTRVVELVKKMFEERHLAFPVLNESGELVGMVTLGDLRRHRASGGSDAETTVEQIMSREVGRIGRQESALEAFQRISRNASGRLVVVDEAGRLIGIISKTDLIRAVQVRMVGLAGEAPEGLEEELGGTAHPV